MLNNKIASAIIGQLLLMVCFVAGARADAWQLAAARELQQWLQPPMVNAFQDDHDGRIDYCGDLVRFYRYRDYRLAWVDRYGLLPEAALALSVIKQAGREGLRYADYYDPWVDELLDGMITRPVVLGEAFNGKQVQFDLVLSDMVLHYIHHRTAGRIDPKMLPDGLAVPVPLPQDFALELAEAMDRDRLAAFFDALGPRQAAYRALQQSLPGYRRIKAAGGWPAIDDGPKLTPGDCGRRVAQLRDRLTVSGECDSAAESEETCFDERLAQAVSRFQHRHGLNPDGVVGPRTLAALNVPVDERIRQIEVNLERWRWMPHELGARHVLVNIPGFQLQMVEEGRVVKTLRTIVGKEDRPTPVLASNITYLELNPFWHVPPTIARKDLLPKIKADPSFLVQQNFRVFDGWDDNAREVNPQAVDWAVLSEGYFPFRLRQEPTVRNALGRVKIMFPNDASVYIHDTPSKSLFQRVSRPFSSGCVRVEEPLELAALLLSRQDWDRARLNQAVASHARQVIPLVEPVPVYLGYFTAWAEANGEVHFREDIYGHDQTLAEALAASAASRTACSHVMRPPAYLGRR